MRHCKYCDQKGFRHRHDIFIKKFSVYKNNSDIKKCMIKLIIEWDDPWLQDKYKSKHIILEILKSHYEISSDDLQKILILM